MVGNKTFYFLLSDTAMYESKGSIIPNFIDLISKGIKTLPITHKR